MFGFFLALLICGVATAPWNVDNSPESHWNDNSLVFDFSQLPLSGETPNTPWSDTYWPSCQSGIAHRWQAEDPQDFEYQTNSLEQLQAMTEDDIKLLSPAEKYDIMQGRYDYPTVNSEWERTHKDDPDWEGICHGWSPAALEYQQPNPVTLNNTDGITVPFGSSDVKALLSFYLAEPAVPASYMDAQRCNTDLEEHPDAADSTECRDINAGALHVLLANTIGREKKGFVIDRDRSIQVWNQPMYSYSAKAMKNDDGTIKVECNVTYGKETQAMWEAHESKLVTEAYVYNLELDSEGAITGGSHTTWDRPDFVWRVQDSSFTGYFTGLGDIYEESIKPAALRSVKRLVRRVAPKGVLESKVPQQHTTLTAPVGSLEFEGPIAKGQFATWSIAPVNASSIELVFTKFATERFREKVKVYEGAMGEGALLAVLHGQKVPKPIKINAKGALVMFAADTFGSHKQQVFTAHYKAH